MNVEVILLPRDLKPVNLEGRTVVVFDVLRATTSMTAALAAGLREFRIFGDTGSAAAARKNFTGPALLVGEEKAIRPPGFDLGNSPGAFTPELCSGRTGFISTTNGTRAIIAARGAADMYIGALVNASAVARVVADRGLNVTLLCSGTQGQISMEDVLGCGALINALAQHTPIIPDSDMVHIARRLFQSARNDLPTALRESKGGHNVIGVGLEPDIDFAARLDSISVVGRVIGEPPVVVPVGYNA
jgi:2-phosphosulfolactate phosphatase